MNIHVVVLVTFLHIFIVSGQEEEESNQSWGVVGNPLLNARPCNGSDDIIVTYEPGLPPEDENQYWMSINKNFPTHTKIELQFDTEASVTIQGNTFARISASGDDNTFLIRFYKSNQGISFKVQGVVIGIVPYIKSLVINNVQFCRHPNIGFLDDLVQGHKDQAISHKTKKDLSCGRRKVTHTELIVNGAATKPGDWPWHVALYKINKNVLKYICGGTLISKSFVLTAAHCTTVRGVQILPEVLSVVLGKYNLIGGDIAAQERSVHEIIVHEEFDIKKLEHDISLLKLSTIVVFNDYIQPACLWHSGVVESLPTGSILGTVVGWGFDQTDSLASELQQATLPILPDSTCIRKNPVFYGKILTEGKFCAGISNGTSPCNGDSGGGFAVFVPDKPRDNSQTEGSWYVRGIVSTTVARTDAPICDPTQNVVFTDIAKYKSWIKNHIKNDLKSEFDKRTATISVSRDNIFSVLFLRPTNEIIVLAKSLNPNEEPTVKSIKIDGLEVCKNLTDADFQYTAVSYRTRKGCGKRQIFYTELINNGESTKPGEWPWHVALYRQDFAVIKYICGGTLISKYFVLSAAHCVHIKGKVIVPEILSVVLGKYNLKGGDFSSEEREVHSIKVHKAFRQKYLENDIAMIKLRTGVVFNDYIQPACLWHKQVTEKLPEEVFGTVVGWGFDHTNSLSAQLHKAVLPILPDHKCFKSNWLYYSTILNGNNFCAGLNNGTSPCNGDSGGGLTVFVPDETDATDNGPNAPGAWFVRGIVSTTVSKPNTLICDPNQNAVFTDVSKYVDWIEEVMETN